MFFVCFLTFFSVIVFIFNIISILLLFLDLAGRPVGQVHYCLLCWVCCDGRMFSCGYFLSLCCSLYHSVLVFE